MTEPIHHRRKVEADPSVPEDWQRAKTRAVAGGFIERDLRARREAQEEAAVQRAAGVAPIEAHPDHRDDRLKGADHGATHQRKSRRLEVVEAVDPNQPAGVSIRRARVRDPLRRMVRTGRLPFRSYLAAEQFRSDLEAANGAVDSEHAPGGASPPWSRTHLRPLQYAAAQRLRVAWQTVIGLIAGGVFSWVVVSHGSLDDYEACRGMRKGQAGRTLRDALERLADHYGLPDSEPPNDWS